MDNYKIINKLYEGVNTIIYNALSEDTNTPVIIKILKFEHPTTKDIMKLKYEYDIGKNIDMEGAIKYIDFIKFKGTPALVLEDFGGTSLNNIINEKKIDLPLFLSIATQLSHILDELYKLKIIHKDIKTSNIIFNSNTQKVKLIDFGISSYDTNKTETSEEGILEGTLTYISPEQTGRINKKIDHRSDIYSLGVTLYELITGQLPFKQTDPMELVHAHIALIPEAPSKINPNIPKVISDIIMKMLAKNIDDRYQTAIGLEADFKLCLEQYTKNGKIEEFTIGKYDVSDKLQITQKIYGRDNELKELFEFVNNIRDKENGLILIEGYQGIGKTKLLTEFQHKLLFNLNKLNNDHIYWISGIYDKFKQNIQYHGIIEAFNMLIKKILTKTPDKINHYKKEILKAVGINGQVVIEIIPTLEKIIGKQPQVEQLDATTSQNRFIMVFQDFIKVFAKDILIIFLDDFQYVDDASMKLIEKIISQPETKNILIIGAYRDSEVDEEHILKKYTKKIKESNISVKELKLKPLSKEAIGDLLADTLSKKSNELSDLIEAVLGKTNGNPFFISYYLDKIYEEKLLFFDIDKCSWNWDISKINETSITDNVAQLMGDKINNLKEDAQRLLKYASVIGIDFDLQLLAYLNNDNKFTKTSNTLINAIEEGLILPIGEDYKYISEDIDNYNDFNLKYRFIHKQIHNTTYNLIEENERNLLHKKIGQYMLKHINEPKVDYDLFNVVNHLNISKSLINDHNEIKELIELNLQASQKSTELSAFENAAKYTRIATEILPEYFWEKEYDLTFKLYLNRANTESTVFNREKAEEMLNNIMDKAKTDINKFEIYNTLVNIKARQGKLKEAIDIGINALKLFNIEIPQDKEGLKNLIEEEKKELEQNMIGKTLDDVKYFPPMEDKKNKLIMFVLDNIFAVASNSGNYDLSNPIIFKMVNMCFKYGNTKKASYYYILYSGYIGMIERRIDEAYNWGIMAIKLADETNDPSIISRVYNSFAIYVNPLKNHPKTSFFYIDKAIKRALEAGLLGDAGIIIVNKSSKMLNMGENLNSTLEYVENGIILANRIGNPNIKSALMLFKTTILCLLGLTESKISFNFDEFNEKDFLDNLHKSNFGVGIVWYYQLKIKTLFIFNEYEKQIELKEHSDKLKSENFENDFYHFYALTQMYDKIKEENKKETNEYLEKIIDISKKAIEDKQVLCLSYLVLGEYERINSNFNKAAEYFDKAIEESIKADNIIETAIANELTAKLFIQNKCDVMAKIFMTEAYHCYRNWGAVRKLKDLEENYQKYISVLSESKTEPELTDATISLTTTGETSDILDLATVMKSSQTISREIVLNKLLGKLMNIVIENAGAERGILILEEKNTLLIQAEIEKDKETKILQNIPVDNSKIVAESIVNYVRQTHEDIVIDNATIEPEYQQDPYIINNKPKSVLVVPLINHGKFTGILYLENNITIGAFTKKRVEVLKMLSSQISISIENARLYGELEEYNLHLEDMVKKRTEELDKANKVLKKAFRRVNSLKKQQDGDYFLTSLLIKPLIANKIQSNKIKTEFYLSQKKKFSFREWDAELGGDVCIAHSIVLSEKGKNKEFVVFVNGDAMGKSIQGAGGALVLGVVFNTFVKRTKYIPGASDISPEEWLIRCYKELQDVFVSFDGTMLTSVAMGIIDEKSGTMYYFNSEHPWSVLYRDNKASFLKQGFLNRKIGTTIGMDKLSIDTLKLEAGDVIICGSDGRDDLIIGKDEKKGKNIINNDMNAFLRFVENGKGNLETIVENIKNYGKLMDDLSLLKITYKPNNKNKEELKIPDEFFKYKEEGIKAYETNDYNNAIKHLRSAINLYNDEDAYCKLIHCCILIKNFSMAITYSEKSMVHFPTNSNLIYYTSISYKKCKQYEKAIYYGRRLYIHKPNSINNLINLIDSYRLIGDYSHASKYLKEAEKIESNNKTIIKLKNILSQREK